jgi:hypothetical protein
MANISTIKVGSTSYGITPASHASTATTYGAATASNYGHVKLSDNYTSSAGAAASGIGASSAAVYNAYNTLNSKLARKTYGTDVLSVHTFISNEYLRFFAIEYNDFIIISMKGYTNVAINTTTWTNLISGLPTISWAQPLKVFNSDNQSRSFPDAIYSDGKITLITVSGQKYFNAGENIFISGVVMK